MARLQSLALLVGSLVACGSEQTREDAGTGRDGQTQEDADGAVQRGDAAPFVDGAQTDDATAAVDAGAADANAPDADAADADAANDASAVADGATPCLLPPLDTVCSSRLCSLDGEVWLSVRGDEPWYVGGLDWSVFVCGRSLGFPRARSASGLELGFRLSGADEAQLRAQTALQVAWGESLEGPGGPKVCSFSAAGTLPNCDFEGPCTATARARVSELPPRPECLPCPADVGIDPCFGAGSCACWCQSYNDLHDACPALLP